jgi:hypothetical protein
VKALGIEGRAVSPIYENKIGISPDDTDQLIWYSSAQMEKMV